MYRSFLEFNSFYLELIWSEKGLRHVNISISPFERKEQDNFIKDYPFSQKLILFLKNPLEPLDLVVDLEGTPFQMLIWNHLRSIPYGTTISYKKIAEAALKPQASRAVARVCSQNPLALIIPCHRVISSQGELSSYKWGKNIKELLLKNEKAPK